MKNKIAIIYVIIAISMLFIAIILPEKKYYGELTFSVASGFFDEEFDLELNAPAGYQIYYTLDGSFPTADSIAYKGPIHIYDASVNDNVYSMRTDISASYLQDEIDQYSYMQYSAGYVVPDFCVDKCTIIRAACYDSDGYLVDEKSASYFIGYGDRREYENMHIVSLITDPDNLFDYNKGIYVLGKEYDNFVQNERDDSMYTPWWSHWGANYTQIGPEWERPVEVQIFDKDRALVIDQECGMRISGSGSRGYLPRNINLFAREEYSAGERFNYDLFGTGIYVHKMTLFAGGDDRVSKITDRIISDLTKDCAFLTMNYEPCMMFLDGEYWGTYYLVDSFNEDTIEATYGVGSKDVVIIKGKALEHGTQDDLYEYINLMEYIKNTDFSIAENYLDLQNKIDIESFIDYYACQMYIARNGDWPGSNEAMWKSKRNDSSNPYADRRWRWIIYDVNSCDTMMSSMLGFDSFSYLMEDEIFSSIWRNPDFQQSFLSRFEELADTVFLPDTVNALIDGYEQEMNDAMMLGARRFLGNYLADDYFINGCEDVRTFYNNRREIIFGYIDSYGQ